MKAIKVNKLLDSKIIESLHIDNNNLIGKQAEIIIHIKDKVECYIDTKFVKKTIKLDNLTAISGYQKISREYQKLQNKDLSGTLNELKIKYAQLPIKWSDEEPESDELFGIWKNNPRTFEQIREKAWKRN